MHAQPQKPTTNQNAPSTHAPVVPQLTVKTGVKAGRIAGNHNAIQNAPPPANAPVVPRLTVKTGVKVGRIAVNHNPIRL